LTATYLHQHSFDLTLVTCPHRILTGMFTPPPSPSPPELKFQQPINDSSLNIATDDILSPVSPSSADAKRTISRRTKWAVLAVPLVLVLITATTRYLTHPAAFDILAGSSEGDSWIALGDWRPHKRHPEPQSAGSSVAFPTAPLTSSSLASTTATSLTPGASAQTVPTIPSVSPALPSPFPQVFDTSLQANFSTTGCQNFFLNMTSTPAFNSCRPFSLLLQSSQAFNKVGRFTVSVVRRKR